MQWGRVFIDVGCLSLSLLLGPPVNLWTTGTVGQQFVLSVHCVKLVGVVSPLVTVILSRNVFIF